MSSSSVGFFPGPFLAIDNNVPGGLEGFPLTELLLDNVVRDLEVADACSGGGFNGSDGWTGIELDGDGTRLDDFSICISFASRAAILSSVLITAYILKIVHHSGSAIINILTSLDSLSRL